MANTGLFGSNDLLQELLAKRQQEALLQSTQLGNLFAQTAGNRSQAATNKIGAEIGASFGQGLSKSLFGEGKQIEDARGNVEKEKALQIEQAKVMTERDPVAMRQFASKLYEAGLTEQAKQVMDIVTAPAKDRAILKSADDRQRFVDTGELVFPDVDMTKKDDKTVKMRQQLELEAQGISREVAQDAVFGITKQITDPTTGDIVLYDPRKKKNVGRVTKQSQEGGPLPVGTNVSGKVLSKGSKVEDKIDKQVTQLSTALEKANILETESIFDLVEKQILNKKEDLAGFGQTGFLPAVMLSDEGLANRQLIAQLQNITLKNRSGAAVAASEFERLKKELGTGAITGDREVRNALSRMSELYKEHKHKLRAGFSDSVNKEYDRRLGLPVDSPIEEEQVGRFTVRVK